MNYDDIEDDDPSYNDVAPSDDPYGTDLPLCPQCGVQVAPKQRTCFHCGYCLSCDN